MEVQGALHDGFFRPYIYIYIYIYIYMCVCVEFVELKHMLDPILCFPKQFTKFENFGKVTFCV